MILILQKKIIILAEEMGRSGKTRGDKTEMLSPSPPHTFRSFWQISVENSKNLIPTYPTPLIPIMSSKKLTKTPFLLRNLQNAGYWWIMRY
jgi:hypothetical protein